MATLALEINDAGIRAKRDGDRRASLDSPGYAMIEGDRVLTGAAARAACRLRPRHVDNRFWAELDTTPLPSPFRDGVSRADLAHAHLEAIWGKTGKGVNEAILVLPGSYSDDQLGLLLGIAQACDVPVKGLVDAALASCLTQPVRSQLLHLDLQFHRVVVTELLSGSELARREVKIASNVGLATLQDAWARRVAERFVRDTRFDPLHVAATEQALYDALPALLNDLHGRERAELEIEAAGKRRSVELTRRELVGVAAETFDVVANLVGQLARAGRRANVLLSHRAAMVPGLSARLAELGEIELATLDPDASLEGALANREVIRSDGPAFAFVTRLPLKQRDARAVPPKVKVETAPLVSEERRGDPPTHLLHEGRAFPILEEPLVIGMAVSDERRGIQLTGATAGISRSHCSVYLRNGRGRVRDHSRHGTFLNGQRVDRTAALLTGDRLRMGAPGIELLAIRVEQDNGAPPH
jgi:hypothetical protein